MNILDTLAPVDGSNVRSNSVLARVLAENPNHRLVVTGHSLGAGVASLLTLMLDRYVRKAVLRSNAEGLLETEVRGYCFSPPGCMIAETGLPMTQRHILSPVRDSTPTYPNFS
jgi:pimeloyl-ACP methyl ester carboxylesterase